MWLLFVVLGGFGKAFYLFILFVLYFAARVFTLAHNHIQAVK